MKRVDNNEYCVYLNDCGAWDGPNSKTVDILYAVCNMLEKRESSIALKTSTRIKYMEATRTIAECKRYCNTAQVLHLSTTKLSLLQTCSWFKKKLPGCQQQLAIY